MVAEAVALLPNEDVFSFVAFALGPAAIDLSPVDIESKPNAIPPEPVAFALCPIATVLAPPDLACLPIETAASPSHLQLNLGQQCRLRLQQNHDQLRLHYY